MLKKGKFFTYNLGQHAEREAILQIWLYILCTAKAALEQLVNYFHFSITCTITLYHPTTASKNER